MHGSTSWTYAHEEPHDPAHVDRGPTFGTIAALYGLTNGYIYQAEYTILVAVVILSAVVPTLIATTFFEPEAASDEAFEDFEAAEEIDAGPVPLPRHATR